MKTAPVECQKSLSVYASYMYPASTNGLIVFSSDSVQ